MRYALGYLFAIITANVVIGFMGEVAAPFVAFFMIGATLTFRDKLHQILGPRRVLLLVVLGTMISYITGNPATQKVALAAAFAFLASETVDTWVYHLLLNRDWRDRALYSNIAGAAVDSIIFPVLAFGGFPIAIILLQFVAKNLGGMVWIMIISHTQKPKPLKVYLSGPIFRATEAESVTWRDYLKVTCPEVCFLDPVDCGYTEEDHVERYSEIVSGDINAIAECDIVVAFLFRPSIGTSMELWEAHKTRKPILLISDLPHAWLLYVSDEIVERVEDARDAIRYYAKHREDLPRRLAV